MLEPTDLLGEWELDRHVLDRRAGVDGTVAGTTVLTATGPDEVRWEESGTMRFDGRTVPVSRTLVVRRTGGSWTVHFSDDRVFHPWVWGTSVSHACTPDDYTGVLEGDADRWSVRWEAHGPAKDYVLESVLRRTRTAD
ncbi:DUF6314 family protein [Curtobacterium luteum]|uniref:DUF6314 family protein n=1 Tax=Curtobacterium luteum TaxID=33881 RepID=UPI0038206F31